MVANTQKINAKSVLGYVFLPGIIPRFKELFSGSFSYLAFLFAQLFEAVRILPPTHPYTKSRNMGTFTVRQVLATAANHIEFSRKNADQVTVYILILASIILLLLQAALFLLNVLVGKALASPPAAPPGFTTIFQTPHPQTDIAFLMLDYVFGIPGSTGGTSTFFGSNALIGSNGPTPFHQGMHALFEFYNYAILLVAVLIFMYYVFVVVIETAQTGVPFGARFSKVYAPLRLVTAIGLLIPLNYGFNSAQYITLTAAKMGSSFATNGWTTYNRITANPAGVTNSSILAQVRPPEILGIAQFGSVYHACREIYATYVAKNITATGATRREIKPYVIVNGTAKEFLSYPYQQAKQDLGKNTLSVILGELDPSEHRDFAGGVRPYCGVIQIDMNNDNPQGFTGNADTGGVRRVERAYYELVRQILIVESTNRMQAIGERSARAYIPVPHISEGGIQDPCYRSSDLGDSATCGRPLVFPPVTAVQDDFDAYQVNTRAVINDAYTNFRSNLNLQLPDELVRRGWGGAGIWYNRIAEINGTFTAAVYAVPTVQKYPEVMEFIKDRKRETDTNSEACKSFDPNLANNIQIEYPNPYDQGVAQATVKMYEFWACDRPGEPNPLPRGMTGNAVLDLIGTVFGINGLFQMREQTKADPATGQPQTHPVAALTAVGKALLENAIRSTGMAIGASFGGGLTAILGRHVGAALQSLSSMFISIATIGLTAGFILYYILPFLPFIYFFFAVGSWVKSIFEAMVGVPLWALAHLKIDGEGFSGPAAAGGYFLILEIMLRPFATVLGLIGGFATFSAMVAVLNTLFDLVVANIVGDVPSATSGRSITVGGAEFLRRGQIDQFFFTITYAILVYMMATASFKMIDMVPKYFMRWIGSSVSTFNDATGDPTQNLTSYTAIAGQSIGPQVLGGITGASRATGQGISAVIEELSSQGGASAPRGGAG